MGFLRRSWTHGLSYFSDSFYGPAPYSAHIFISLLKNLIHLFTWFSRFYCSAHSHTYWFQEKHLSICICVYLFVRVWSQALRDKELSSLDDSEARLTDMSSHLMCVAVGQSPLGPNSGVNSQMECQKQYTSLSSLFFLGSLLRNTFQAWKRARSKSFWKQCGSTEGDISKTNWCLLRSCDSTVCYI